MTEPAETPPEADRIDLLHQVLESGSVRKATRMLNALHPAEIAHVLQSLPPRQRKIVWQMVDHAAEGEVLLYLNDDVRDEILRGMDATEILAAAEGLDVDDLADLVQDLPAKVTSEVLSSLDEQRRERLETALSYPEDSAGGLMNPDVVTVRPEVTLDVVLRYLRRRKDGLPELTDNLIVVSRQGRYLGVLYLTDLLTSDPDDSVAEVMTLDVQPIPADAKARDVANRFEQLDLITAPVIDPDGRVLGRITVDDVMDVIREEADHQFLGHAGLSEGEDMFAPVLLSARRRAVWLGINLMTAFLAAWVIGLFEATIEKVVALAVLMPVVASMGGIAGTQTLTLAIRGIALGQLSAKNIRWLVSKEMAVAALNGLLWALVVASIAWLWFGNSSIALIIATAITLNVLAATLAGALLPLVLDRFGIDPALAGGVILTTVTDVVGFLSFLGLATLFLL
ncbi:magnesium transporter [Lamprobacter modestohalophilus]|uniref:Magnesium transporter MgtE n=1 Tax=Lamprobacter modestohalophilus TaxID=1064514 RepID=A0A9X0W644_9GAMM|nr:magnesium transporter [Lamprobacter modestohalophilus]MBK1617678.1 magnesium transporter [Lamprobacter modestohalophilus]MCF7979963.1 magnesium transporter [Chromatiaceae bacterium]MCF7994231.1 magnesium transporter [Chromatiaceae bacterium]